MNIDDIDRKILEILYTDGRASAKSIAEQIFISAPTVASRIENLKKNNIIKGFYAEINPEALGNVIRAYIEMNVDPNRRETLFTHLKSCPQVLKCSRITGEYSLLLEVFFRSTDEMDGFTTNLQHFGKTKTQIVFSTILENKPFI